jgi:hypothetical protein
MTDIDREAIQAENPDLRASVERGLADSVEGLVVEIGFAPSEADVDGAWREGHGEGVTEGIRLAAKYIDRVGRLIGTNESRLKMFQVPDFLRQLADAVDAGAVEL